MSTINLDSGFQSTACSVISLLGLSWILGRWNLSEQLVRNNINEDLMFVFVNGENWNYYGTSTWVRLINERQFPHSKQSTLINHEHIDLIVNIDQFGCQSRKLHILHGKLHPFLFNLTFDKISTQDE